MKFAYGIQIPANQILVYLEYLDGMRRNRVELDGMLRNRVELDGIGRNGRMDRMKEWMYSIWRERGRRERWRGVFEALGSRPNLSN